MFEFNAEKPFDTDKIRHAVNWFFSETGFNNNGMRIDIKGVTQFDFDIYGAEKNKIWGTASRYQDVKHKFLIKLKKSLLASNEALLIFILFEELSHVVQYEKGEMSDCKNRSTRFKGKFYKPDHEYEKCPWEIEAKADAKKLTVKYFQYRKKEYGTSAL